MYNLRLCTLCGKQKPKHAYKREIMVLSESLNAFDPLMDPRNNNHHNKPTKCVFSQLLDETPSTREDLSALSVWPTSRYNFFWCTFPMGTSHIVMSSGVVAVATAKCLLATVSSHLSKELMIYRADRDMTCVFHKPILWNSRRKQQEHVNHFVHNV